MVTVASLREEYYLITDFLDKVNWALEGDCDDVDCDKYTFRCCLKKKFRPILEHGYSCIEHLKRKKTTLMRLLSQTKYKRFRFKKCSVCKKNLDTLGKDYTLTSFTKPLKERKRYSQLELISSHKKCQRKVETPEGFSKMF